MIRLSKTRMIYILVLAAASCFLLWDRSGGAGKEPRTVRKDKNSETAATRGTLEGKEKQADGGFLLSAVTSGTMNQWLMSRLSGVKGGSGPKFLPGSENAAEIRDLFGPSLNFRKWQEQRSQSQAEQTPLSLQKMKITSILIEDKERYVQIEGEIYKINDIIGTWVLRDIQEGFIVLKDDSNEYNVCIDDTVMTQK